MITQTTFKKKRIAVLATRPANLVRPNGTLRTMELYVPSLRSLHAADVSVTSEFNAVVVTTTIAGASSPGVFARHATW